MPAESLYVLLRLLGRYLYFSFYKKDDKNLKTELGSKLIHYQVKWTDNNIEVLCGPQTWSVQHHTGLKSKF